MNCHLCVCVWLMITNLYMHQSLIVHGIYALWVVIDDNKYICIWHSTHHLFLWKNGIDCAHAICISHPMKYLEQMFLKLECIQTSSYWSYRHINSNDPTEPCSFLCFVDWTWDHLPDSIWPQQESFKEVHSCWGPPLTWFFWCLNLVSWKYNILLWI